MIASADISRSVSPDRRGAARPLSVAPMMDWTDRHFRWMLRLITKRTLLYTEMITAAAVLRGDRERLLGFGPEEHPLALQLGGDDPRMMAAAARIGADLGYDEININVGCPSDRVQSGRFGACLMADPRVVADLTDSIRSAVRVPVTVKHRIGVDGREEYEDLARFVEVVAGAGCDRFIVHARIAVLGGLSPHENRTIPPLRHADVHRLKQEFPRLAIELNGGIRNLEEARRHLAHTDGVMIGRAVYEDPYLLAGADDSFYSAAAGGGQGQGDGKSIGPRQRSLTPTELAQEMIPYIERQCARGLHPKAVTRHMLGLFRGRPGARGWRRHLSENGPKETDPRRLLLAALQFAPTQLE